MSTRRPGRASRKFSSGTRLWPPASTFTSSTWRSSSASVSSTDVGASYSKIGGFTLRASAVVDRQGQPAATALAAEEQREHGDQQAHTRDGGGALEDRPGHHV